MRSVLVVNSSLISTGSLTTTVSPKIGSRSVNAEPYRLAIAATDFSRAATKADALQKLGNPRCGR